MSSARKSVKVRQGNAHLTVYPWTHPGTGAARWRFAWRARRDLPWQYVTRAKKADALAAAETKLAEIETGGLVWSALPPARRRFLEAMHRKTRPEDESAVLAFLAGRQRSAEIVASVARFLAWKVATAGEETRNLANVRRNLEPMAKHFAGRTILDVTAPDLIAWWQTRCESLTWKTRNEIRGSLVSFWNWCVWEQLHPKEVTPADRIPRAAAEPHERRVITLKEIQQVFEHVRPNFRAWAVLSVFAGFRPEELAPPQKKGMSKRHKRGLRREEIDWQFNVIRVPGEVTKTGYPRNVPLLPATRAWLLWAGVRPGQTGPVCALNPVESDETARLGKMVFKTGWPQDAMRHSFGSYRIATIQSLAQVALEMGTSEAMLRKHYHNPKAPEEGEAWFALMPPPIRQGSDETEVSAQEYVAKLSAGR